MSRLTEDDIDTIRIHLQAIKEELCNQRRWNEAREYEELIDKLQSIPQWIPCSKQMPPVGKTVLVTVKTENDIWTDCDTWYQGGWLAYMGNDREVIAWCELPTPYKEAT